MLIKMNNDNSYIIQLSMLGAVINWRWQKFLLKHVLQLKSFVTFFKKLESGNNKITQKGMRQMIEKIRKILTLSMNIMMKFIGNLYFR